MKKLMVLLLALVCVLGLVACYARDTDNTESQTETVSNTRTEEPASLQTNTQSTNATENLNDIIPMVMIEGKLYFDSGRESTVEARCGMMDGEITSSVESWEEPTKDNQSNFGVGYGYQIGSEEGTVEIYMNEKWWVFETETTK